MPLPASIQAELSARRAEEHRRARRDTWRDIGLTCLQLMGWCAAGLISLAFSFHVSDEAMGRILFWGGLAMGNGGMLSTLLAAYRRGERRGDW